MLNSGSKRSSAGAKHLEAVWIDISAHQLWQQIIKNKKKDAHVYFVIILSLIVNVLKAAIFIALGNSIPKSSFVLPYRAEQTHKCL